MGKQIAHARVLANQRSLVVVKIFRNDENGLHNIASGKPDVDDSPLDVSRVVLSCNVLLHPWIDAAANGKSSDVPAFDEIQPASSSRAKWLSQPTLKRSTKRTKTSTIRYRSDASKSFSDKMSLIDLDSDSE